MQRTGPLGGGGHLGHLLSRLIFNIGLKERACQLVQLCFFIYIAKSVQGTSLDLVFNNTNMDMVLQRKRDLIGSEQFVIFHHQYTEK